MLFVLRHRQRSDLSAEAQRAKAEAIHAAIHGEMDCFVANAARNDAEEFRNVETDYTPPG
jgi:hypothetical protein